MQSSKIRGLAVAAFVAAGALLAACSGGSKSSMPAVQQQPASSNVTTTLKIVIGGTGTQSAVRSGQTIPVTNSKSIVIRYTGDGTPSTPPTSPWTIPPSAPIATGTPANLTTGAGGNCVVVGTSLACTIAGVSLPVGVEDIYVLDYDNVNGTGNLIYASVSTVQVNANGSFSAPGTTAPTVFLTPLSGNTAVAGASLAFGGGAITIAPNSNAIASTQATYVYSTAISINAFDQNNQPINGPIPSVVVTDNDTSGNTCLVYVKAGGLLGTNTCMFPTPGSKSTATVVNTNDQLYIQYNNAPMSAATGFTLTAPVPAPSASPSVATDKIAFQPMSFKASAISGGPSGGLVAQGANVYVASFNTTANQAILPFTFSSATGKLTGSSAIVPTPGLTAPVGGMVVGSDSNIWFYQLDGKIGVYAVTNAAGAVAKGTVGVSATAPGGLPVGIVAFGGYIWVIDTTPNVIRIDPTQGVTLTNTIVAPLTIPSGAGLLAFAGLAATSTSATLYSSTTNGSTFKVVVNTASNATTANLITTVAESLQLGGAPGSGISLPSDGNVWTVQGGTNNSTYRYMNPTSLILSSLAAFDNPTGNLTIEGGLAQGGADNMIVTTAQGTAAGASAASALSWTTLNGSASGYFGEGATGTCISTGTYFSGQAVIALGGYFIHASNNAGNVCVAVP